MQCDQLILELPLSPDYSLDSFIAKGENRQVIERIQQLDASPQQSFTLTGAAGTGKTHLLRAAVLRHGGQHAPPHARGIYLDMATLGQKVAGQGEEKLSALLTHHGRYSLVAVDDLHQLEDHPPLQEAVLFLFNQVRHGGGTLLFASRLSPHAMPWLREDLRSRLLWGEILTLVPPSDEELGEILEKMAMDRQVRLSADLVKFLQFRLPRTVPDYAQAMDRLDRAGMGLKHRLTVPLAKKVLGL